MTVAFDRTETQMLDAAVAYAQGTTNGRRRARRQQVQDAVVIGFLGLTLGMALPSAFPGISVNPWWVGGGFGAFLYVWRGLMLASYVRAEVRYDLKNPNVRALLGPMTITVSDQGVLTRTERTETLRKWSAILGVAQAGDFLFLEIAEGYLPIPMAAFSDPDEARRFFDALQGRGTGLESASSWYRSRDITEAAQHQNRRGT